MYAGLMKHYLLLLICCLIMPLPLYSQPLELRLAMITESSEDQNRIAIYLQKLLEERSAGRILASLDSNPSRSADQLVSSLAKDHAAMALVKIKDLESRATILKFLTMPFQNLQRKDFYQEIDAALGCCLYTALSKQNLELLGIWDTGREQHSGLPHSEGLTGPLDRPDCLGDFSSRYPLPQVRSQTTAAKPETKTYFDASALIMARSQWEQLPDDIRIIVQEAVQTATQYAFEIAEHNDCTFTGTDQPGSAISARARQQPFSGDNNCCRPEQDP